jgi:alpha-glucosidase
MKYYMASLIFVLASMISGIGYAQSVRLLSPDKHISLTLAVDGNNQRLCYWISKDKDVLLEKSTLGVIKDGVDMGCNIHLGVTKTQKKKDAFFVYGNHRAVSLVYNETVVPATIKGGEAYWLIVRIYNNGVALKCRFKESGKYMVNGESTSWLLPKGTSVWYQNDLHSYEGLFSKACVDALKSNTIMGLPITCQLKNGRYMMLSESNVVNYSDMAVRTNGEHQMCAYFHADTQGWTSSGNLQQPWRVVMIADNLNSLVNNDMIYSLADKSNIDMKKATWIEPGRSAWQWWSSGDPIYSEQDQWIDRTRKLGFEYYLVDEGWKVWKDGPNDQWECLKRVIDKAKTKGIKIWIWVNSNEVPTAATRLAYFKRLHDIGVSGVKIDFMPPASTQWINWYDETLKDACCYELMVDFHGAVKPSGRSRTWPNEMTREAVRGHEWHILRYDRTLPPSHDCVLPFTRYVQGPADYTPTVLNPKELRGYTWSRELAQAVIFTSPFLCYADNPKNYINSEAADLIRSIPSTWDETIVLPCSKIGECVAFARRKGDTWFVAIMNGNEKCTVNIDLSFLSKDRKYRYECFKDKINEAYTFTKESGTIGNESRLVLTLKPCGGYIGRYKLNF